MTADFFAALYREFLNGGAPAGPGSDWPEIQWWAENILRIRE